MLKNKSTLPKYKVFRITIYNKLVNETFLIKLVNETSVTRCYGLEVIDDLLLRI